jgi:hypothetical protein
VAGGALQDELALLGESLESDAARVRELQAALGNCRKDADGAVRVHEQATKRWQDARSELQDGDEGACCAACCAGGPAVRQHALRAPHGSSL